MYSGEYRSKPKPGCGGVDINLQANLLEKTSLYNDFLSSFLCLKIGFHYVAQADLEFNISPG